MPRAALISFGERFCNRRRAKHFVCNASIPAKPRSPRSKKFRSLFENTVEGIFQTSPKGTYIAANSALARIYGYESASELKAKLTNIASELYVERDRREEFVKLMEKHDVVTNFESRIYRKD